MNLLFSAVIATLLVIANPRLLAAEYDVIIQGGKVVDGTGANPLTTDLAIKDGRIAFIGSLAGQSAKQTIDATGLVVSPGFIDLHSHADMDLFRAPLAENIIRQGVTTLLVGNCGGSPVDAFEYLSNLEQTRTTVNVGMLIGHNSVRRKVMQRDNRHATADELAEMKGYIEAAMRAGAFGMSSGLVYIPGAFAPADELIALARIVDAHGGFYASHMRTESEGVVAAVEETIEVGKQTGIPVHISHHKVAGPSVWGKSIDTLAIVDSARRAGQDVTLDQYPYTASNTNLGVLFPAWSMAGGQAEFVKRMQNPTIRAEVKQGVIDILRNQRSGDELWRVVISQFGKDKTLEGKSFEQVLQARGLQVTLDNAAELAIELQLAGGGRGIYHTMDDKDLERIMTHPHTSVASDGRGTRWQMGNPHPRNYGTYPRVLGHYVRDKKVLDLPTAISKMTAMPAQRMGLKDRGTLRVGKQADVVIFDPETITGKSTFSNPHQYAVGIHYVFVNGVAVLAEQAMTGERTGAVLRHHPRAEG